MYSREFLKENIEKGMTEEFGIKDPGFAEFVIDGWMNDRDNSKWRYEEIVEILPQARKILDVAAGCGTAVYYGLLSGFDVYGIEPEEWKLKFLRYKLADFNYPFEWIQRFQKATGEYLPYRNDSFDCVITYQTLEHVRDIKSVINEMMRVTKQGGGIILKCPDYLSTYEGHYLLPWIPLMPKSLARLYLRLLGRPLNGLKAINYITKGRILGLIKDLVDGNHGLKVEIIDLNRSLFYRGIKNKLMRKFYRFFRFLNYIKSIFRYEVNINLFIKILGK